MSDGPEWFAPKRKGYGSSLPISWQGWVVLLVYLAIATGASRLFADKPIALVAILLPATLVLVMITSRTTKGGWHWHSGGEDDR